MIRIDESESRLPVRGQAPIKPASSVSSPQDDDDLTFEEGYDGGDPGLADMLYAELYADLGTGPKVRLST